uniref:Uncharacterized protein n=1 Tax=viral metagenome TaxID=1070528 RepID=A0A6M3XS73_9ZZZZ
MAYAAASDVAALTPNLLDSGQTNYTTTSTPTLAMVNAALSSGCAIIHAALAAAGYSTPVPSAAAAYGVVVQLNVWYAVSEAESVRMTARVAANERTRAEYWRTKFDNGLKDLLKMDLSRAGISYTGKLYAGGIGISDKDSVESDTDRVQPRFQRGQFGHPDIMRPGEAEDETLN